MSKVIAAIQVRMGSTRLPGKALMRIHGKTSIEWIAERLTQAKEIDQVVLITSADPENDPLITEAERLGLGWYREQDEKDLVARYLNALKKFRADAFVRVTADCPLVDAGLVDQLVRVFRADPSAYDAYTNTVPPTFPDGSDLDVIPRTTLERLDRDIPSGDVHREWVMPYLYAENRGFHIYQLTSGRPLEGYRITLDYPEDLDLITKVFKHFDDRYCSLTEIIDFLDQNPTVRDLVKDRVDATITAASNQRSAAYQRLIDGAKSAYSGSAMKTLALLEHRSELSQQKPFNSIGSEEADAAARVMASGNLSGFVGRAGPPFLGGPCVRQLERDFCDTFGVKHAVSFNSASTALQAAVAALGIGPGDEVITTPYTMSATATAILLNNAIPVFADIDPQTYCLDPQSVEKCITPRTKAILAVNLLGGSAEYDALAKIAKAHTLNIIEDNAQAPAGRYKNRFTGTIGDIGIFSLNVHKVIQCGEGSVLVTNDAHLAYRAQLVRNHGEVVVDDLLGEVDVEYVAGNNFRLSEIHAAIAGEQLKKLEGLNAGRRELAAYLTERLSEFAWVEPCRVSPDITHVYYLYPFQFVREKIGISRDTFVKAMKAEGFNVAAGYQKPLYLFPMYQRKRMFPNSQFPFVSTEYPSSVSYQKGICPVAERMFEDRMITTTVYQPPNTKAEVDAFIDTMHRIDAQVPALQEYERRV